MATIQRVLAVKLDLRLSDAQDKLLWKRLQELSWQAMRYGNLFLRARLNEALGLRLDPSKGDPHDVTKHVRANEKMELSGAVYAAVEREAQGICTRHLKRVLAGAPLPEFREGKSLSIRGHAVSLSESGVRIVFEHDRFYALLSLQSKDCEGGCWFKLPIAKNTATDEYQAPRLHQMAAWATPITRATVHLQKEKGRAILRLTYATEMELPVYGERVATFGPIGREGQLFLRTETETRDYSANLYRLGSMKRDWDKIRRRAMRQIGRRRGHARRKREVLSRLSWDQWLDTHIHQWTRDMIGWLKTQGVGQLTIAPLVGADWPAFSFVQQLKYKGQDAGILVVEETDAMDAATKRAMKREAQRERKKSRKFNESVAEIVNQI